MLRGKSCQPFNGDTKGRIEFFGEVEYHAGFEAVIPLPEIEAALPLAELYERAGLGS
jgi:hypothetical protein